MGDLHTTIIKRMTILRRRPQSLQNNLIDRRMQTSIIYIPEHKSLTWLASSRIHHLNSSNFLSRSFYVQSRLKSELVAGPPRPPLESSSTSARWNLWQTQTTRAWWTRASLSADVRPSYLAASSTRRLATIGDAVAEEKHRR